MPTTHKSAAEAAVQITRDQYGWSTLGQSASVTFGFRGGPPTAEEYYKAANGVLVPENVTTTFSPLNSTQRNQASLALALWSDVADISFLPGFDVYPPGVQVKATPYTNNATVSVVPAFTRVDLKGFFRHGHHFQLLEVGADAPRVTTIFGKHPARVELRIRRSSDPLVELTRRLRGLGELELVLDLLIADFTSLQLRGGTNEWVLGDQSAGPSCEYRSIGYSAPEFIGTSENFTSNEKLKPIPTVPEETYYPRHQIQLGGMLIPDNLSASLDRVAALSPEVRRSLLRACYWLHTSKVVWEHSRSSSYVALVSAIESLLPKPKPGGPGPTRLFCDFLEDHLPGAVTPAERSRFYDLRSDLTHGTETMLSDEILFGVHPYADDQDRLYDRMAVLARAAVYAWLKRQTLV